MNRLNPTRLLAVAVVAAAMAGPAAAQYVPATSAFYGTPAVPYPVYGGNYLTGVSDVINAQGQYLQDRQNAYTQRETARQERVKTQKMIFDQRQYELANTPTKDQVREKTRQQLVLRSMTNPPVEDITTAVSLNMLLQEYTMRHTQGGRGPDVPLDQATLKNINVAPAATAGDPGNPAMLKEGSVPWPLPLRNARFDTNRNAFDKAFDTAMKGVVGSGGPSDESVQTMDTELKDFQAAVNAAKDMSLGDAMHSLTFLRNVGDAVKAFKNPAIVNLVRQNKASPEGKTVADMVESMTMSGLKFAPCIPGQESDYYAFQQSMARYGLSMVSVSNNPKE